MSIYIEGLELPTGEGSELHIRILPDGTVLNHVGIHLGLKALYIHPHGDLIDRSKYEYPGDLKYEKVVISADKEDT